jgi:hypothetical protein
VFADDVAILQADYQTRRSLMTRNRFHPEKNFAHITLTRKGEGMVSDKVFMLGPLVKDGMRITMTDFLYDPDKKTDPVGVSLVISKSPGTSVFFLSYVLLIVSLTGFLVYTWKPLK